MDTQTNLSVVIDIGSSNLVAVAGRKNQEGKIEIAGIAKIPSRGIKRGVIVNIDEVSESLKELVELLESKIQINITYADVAYSGYNIKTADYKGYRIASGEEVNKADILELYNEAKSVKTNQEYRILDIIPQSFFVDGANVGMKAIGSVGKKIEAIFKLILIPEVQFNNLKKVFARINLEMGEVVFGPFATAEAVINSDEKELGVILLDIGSGTTKLAIYQDNVLTHSSIIPFGGDVITNDIKEGCSILYKWAEQLKVQYGGAIGDSANDQKFVTIPAQNGWEKKEISTKSLAYIIQARVEEIIDSVFIQIEKAGVIGKLGSGIIVSGGTADLINIIPLIKFKTGMDARKSNQLIISTGKNSVYDDLTISTALGLLKLTLTKAVVDTVPEKSEKKKKGPFSFKNVIQRIITFVDDDNRDQPLNE